MKNIVLLCGFGWSGSSAVADWLYDSGDFSQPGIEQEILPISFGLCRGLRAAERNTYLDAVLSAYALLPDSKLMKHQIKKSFANSNPHVSIMLFFSRIKYYLYKAARRKLLQRMDSSLSNLLRGEFRTDEHYLRDVSLFFDTLQKIRGANSGRDISKDSREQLEYIFSNIIHHFLDRHADSEKITVLDNAISGYFLDYVKYIDFSRFDNVYVIIVTRDPRDQFVDRVANSLTTFAHSHKGFVGEYLKYQNLINSFMEDCAEEKNVKIFDTNFECFIRNQSGLREKIWNNFLADGVVGGAYRSEKRLFDADKSMRNIGLWKRSGLSRQISYISRELSAFCRD
jgi:hypothetical protein